MIPYQNLKFGVSNVIGNSFITKLRMQNHLYLQVENYMKANAISFTHISSKVKPNKKNDFPKRYDTFVCVCTYNQLNQIKLIIRKDRLTKLKDEINQLSINW